MKMESRALYSSPVGWLEVCSSEKGLVSVIFKEKKEGTQTHIPHHLEEVLKQLDEYFKGTRKEFSLDIDWQGTEFQKKVWREVQKIPFGRTASYGGIARSIGNPGSVRAVGNANGKNRVPIIVPCHRVIGSDGKLVGFGGGLWRKEWLLRHERENMPVLSQ
jgi:methylated-DNA-[protein]-cysteine S-methyltransferase